MSDDEKKEVKKVRVTALFNEEDHLRLKLIALDNKMTIAQLIAQAVIEKLEKLEKKA